MNIQTIDPLKIAEKLDHVRNFLLPKVAEEIEKQPRLVEALWFIQSASMPENYAGGLEKFASDLIEKYSDQFFPVGISKGKKPSTDELLDAVMSTPYPKSFFPRAALARESMLRFGRSDRFPDVLSDDVLSPEDQDHFEKMMRQEISRVYLPALQDECIAAAKSDLASFLLAVCTDPKVTFFNEKAEGNDYRVPISRLWYAPKIWECIFDFMDEHAVSVGGSFAETSITRQIFKWLRLAQDTGKGVLFLGHSRFGKSRAIRSYAKMFPGKVRLVECPASGCESDFLREICRALGIKFKASFPALYEQRGAIDAVIRSAKFLLIFDEAQMLYPQGTSRRAEPKRLNYVRRQFMDNGIATAFICTHQNWKSVEKNFLRISTYSNEQFEGRLLLKPIHLSDSLTEEEMVEVARIHLPELSTKYLKCLVEGVRVYQGDQLSSIENIALLARNHAGERGQTVPRIDDLEKAIGEVLGCFSEKTPQASQDRTEQPLLANRQPASEADFSPALARSEQPGRTINPAARAGRISSDLEPNLTVNSRGQGSSLLRLNEPETDQETQIEDPSLVLAD